MLGIFFNVAKSDHGEGHRAESLGIEKCEIFDDVT